MKYLNIIALTIISLITFNCTKNDTDTIILLGKESYVKDFHDIVEDESFIKAFTGGSTVKIHDGFIPPNIEGEYEFNTKRYASNDPTWILSVPGQTFKLKVENQHNRIATATLKEIFETTTDPVYISGNANSTDVDKSFTVYFKEKTPAPADTSVLVERTWILSGEMKYDASDNCNKIKLLRLGYIITDNGGIASIASPGHYYIYESKND